MPVNCSDADLFGHTFSVRLDSKFVTEQSLEITPHLQRVATLPCEILGSLLNSLTQSVVTVYLLQLVCVVLDIVLYQPWLTIYFCGCFFFLVLILLPRDSYAKRGICRRHVSVCVCVCLYVKLRYCIKTAKRRIM